MPGGEHLSFLRKLEPGLFGVLYNSRQSDRIEVALIERNTAFFDYAGHDAGFCRAGTNRANAAVGRGHPIDRRTHFCCSEESVFADVHWSTAGMASLAVNCDRVPLNPEG